MNQPEEIAAGILKAFDMPYENRAALDKRLAVTARDAQYYKDGKKFRNPPGKKKASEQRKQPNSALRKVSMKLEYMDDRVFRAVNCQLFEGDIPLLDSVQSRSSGGRTDAPQRIAEVLYELSERLSEHIETIRPAEGKGGRDDSFTRIVALELAYIFSTLTGRNRPAALTGEVMKPTGRFMTFFVMRFLCGVSFYPRRLS